MIERIYQGPADLEAMIGLLHATRPAGWSENYPAEVDLRELFASPVIQNRTRLWLDGDGRLAAFALVDPSHNIWFEGVDLDAVAVEMFDWGAAVLLRDSTGEPEELALDTNCRMDDVQRQNLLLRNGFERQSVQTIRLERRLEGVLPVVRLPDVFELRPWVLEEGIDVILDLHNAAFGDDSLSEEEARAMLCGVDEIWTAPLVVAAPDESLVGYCVCWMDRKANRQSGIQNAHIDPVAVHPKFQRRGFARALLAAGMLTLRAVGAAQVELGTSSENSAMLAAAQAMGFVVVETKSWFSKNVTPNMTSDTTMPD
jgi:mycothiol synthase